MVKLGQSQGFQAKPERSLTGTTRGQLVRETVLLDSESQIGPGTIACLVNPPLVPTQQGIYQWQVWEPKLGHPEANCETSGQMLKTPLKAFFRGLEESSTQISHELMTPVYT